MKGSELKKILQKSGYKQNLIAEKIGESPQNFNAMLAVEDVKTGTLERIARAIKENLYFFYSDEKYKDLVPQQQNHPFEANKWEDITSFYLSQLNEAREEIGKLKYQLQQEKEKVSSSSELTSGEPILQ